MLLYDIFKIFRKKNMPNEYDLDPIDFVSVPKTFFSQPVLT